MTSKIARWQRFFSPVICFCQNKWLLWVLRLTFCLTLIAATVIGCGWTLSEHSVRFGCLHGLGEFGRLPPLPVNASGAGRKQPVKRKAETEENLSLETATHYANSIKELWLQASEAEKNGNLAQARQLLNEYLERSNSEDTSDNPGHWQEWRNSAIDQLDAMTAFNQGARLTDLKAYLDARRAYDYWSINVADSTSSKMQPPRPCFSGPCAAATPNAETHKAHEQYTQALQSLLNTQPHDPRLADNFAYLRAAVLYRQGEMDQAIRAFNQLAAQYPHSEKREAALYMVGVVAMKKSCVPKSGPAPVQNQSPRHQAGTDGDDIDDHRCDDTWTMARAAFQRVRREYPRGNYAGEAQGWIAYLLLHSGDRAGALVEYYRLLGAAPDDDARHNALVSLSLTRDRATEEDMQRIEAQLAHEPVAALAYAYHNIFNYSSNAGSYAIDYGSNLTRETERMKEKMREEVMAEAKRKEILRIATFATRLMQRYPQAVISGRFALRVAQADLELGEFQAARVMAERALKLSVRGDERAEALWVKGVAAHQLRDYRTARQTLTTLVNEFPNGDLVEGARRLLAMVAEDAGDLDAALEQYLALKYQDDVAYFVDVLMTPEQLAGFIERHPRVKSRDELLYSLGVRYLREWRWNEARATLTRLQTVKDDDQWFSYYDRTHHASAKESGGNYNSESGILASWVLRDLQTINDLNHLQRIVDEAQGDEAKAEALYQLASYVYEERELLFYNPAVWGRGRPWKLYYLAEQNNFRAPGEAQVFWDYLQSHDYPARALPLYLEVVRRFPHTRAAHDALYTAAVCHERLANFNGLWRALYGQGLHAGERMVTYANVKATYPKYQLPRGSTGWKPSTRTVNGGPGWEAPPKPPKPKPRPTWRMRLKQKLASFEQQTAMVWKGKVRPWLIFGVMLVSLLCGGYITLIAAVLLKQDKQRSTLPEIITLSLSSPSVNEPEAESKVERIINSG